MVFIDEPVTKKLHILHEHMIIFWKLYFDFLRLFLIIQNEKSNLEDLNSKQEFIDKQKSELTELNKKLNELKQEIESKNSQITSYLIEIKEMNQEKNQLNQNITELESKKIELMNKIHSTESSNSENDSTTEIQNLIKVYFRNLKN